MLVVPCVAGLIQKRSVGQELSWTVLDILALPLSAPDPQFSAVTSLVFVASGNALGVLQREAPLSGWAPWLRLVAVWAAAGEETASRVETWTGQDCVWTTPSGIAPLLHVVLSKEYRCHLKHVIIFGSKDGVTESIARRTIAELQKEIQVTLVPCYEMIPVSGPPPQGYLDALSAGQSLALLCGSGKVVDAAVDKLVDSSGLSKARVCELLTIVTSAETARAAARRKGLRFVDHL